MNATEDAIRIDAVAMKNEIQARLQAERDEVGEAEFNARHQRWLDTSNEPLAVWWRSLARAEK